MSSAPFMGYPAIAAGIQTINDLAPDGVGDLELTTSDIPAVASEVELAGRFDLVGTEYQIDRPLRLGPGGLDLTASGNTLAGIPPYGEIQGTTGCLIQGDSASALVGGVMPMRNVSVLNVGSGSDIDIHSIATQLLAIENVVLLGQIAGTFSNILGGALIDGLVHLPQAPNAIGLVLQGVLTGSIRCSAAGFSPGGTPYTVLTVSAGATVGTMAIRDGFLQGATSSDSFLYIDDAITIGPTFVLDVIGNEVAGRLGSLFAPGSITASDSRVASIANINGPSSRYQGDPVFDGGGVPIQLVHAAGIDVVPSQNADIVPAVLSPGANDERFALVINGLQDWFLEYTGRISNIAGRIYMQASVSRVGGANRPFSLTAQIDVGGLGVWVDIADATAQTELTPTDKTVSKSVPLRVQIGDRIRLRAESTDGTTTAFSSYSIGFSGQP